MLLSCKVCGLFLGEAGGGLEGIEITCPLCLALRARLKCVSDNSMDCYWEIPAAIQWSIAVFAKARETDDLDEALVKRRGDFLGG